ncbi:MAG: hypothetical protein PHH54_04555 [Candidatus Nanoarchaeia archaeon]|nr:hypothetical protein [Candidatus Nanoarchaeia archaeon]MDD5741228.1 hypothetical protein [Candidatus Nanoarchaeia archaeon]
MKIRMTYQEGKVEIIDLEARDPNTPLQLDSLSLTFRAYVEGVAKVYGENMKMLEDKHKDNIPEGNLEMELKLARKEIPKQNGNY